MQQHLQTVAEVLQPENDPNRKNGTTTSTPSDERKQRLIAEHIADIEAIIARLQPARKKDIDISEQCIYNAHTKLVCACANILLAKKNRTFVIDDYNRDVLRFLLYYFNGSPLALSVFPDRPYDLNKNIMLIGKAGTGKTLMMDIFAMYLRETHNYRAYTVISQTELLNYYKQHNNIDFYTYNTAEQRAYEGKPFSLCLNDIGLNTQRFYGNDTQQIVDEFLYARNEIWEQRDKATHITTNLDKDEFRERFYDDHNRLADRFKMFNVIPLEGESRR